MASSHETIRCGICNEQDKIKHADKWCPECDEGLCVDCETHHRISKASRHHAVITIDDYKGLPTDISKIHNHCKVHDRKFKNYCIFHDKPCCPHCISDHKTCSGLVAIETIVKDAKTSSLLETIDQSLRDSKMNIETIINDREQNLSKIKVQRKQVQKKIKDTREQVNSHLDNLESKLLKELDAVEALLVSQIEHLLEQFKEKSNVVNRLQHNLTTIKTYASDLQTFFGSKQLEKQADLEEKYIRSLANNDSCQTIDLRYTINEQISDISKVSTFGSVTIKKEPTAIDDHIQKDKQAQIMSAVKMNSGCINDIKLTLVRTFNLPKGKKPTILTGCDILHNGQIAFADFDKNKRIIITDDHGVLQNEISLSPIRSFDVTCLDINLVAFTSASDYKIQILNTASQTITKTIPTGECHGITNRQGNLLYCERDIGIISHQLETKSSNTVVSTVVRQTIPSWTYVTSTENNIYHTNYASGSVTCYNMDGDKKWEFKDASILASPHGVAVDEHSNLYVASTENKSIILISADGKESRKMLISKDGIKDPWALAVDKLNGNLVVTNIPGEVLIYKISSRI